MSPDLLEIILGFVLNPFFLMSLFFWLTILVLVRIFRNKRGAINVLFPFLALAGTKKLNKILKRISQWHPKFWRIIWTIGVFVSFSFVIIGMWFIFNTLINLIFQPSIEYAVLPIIPGVTISYDRFLYLMIPILFVVTVHEFSHAIAAGADGLEVKSTGVFGMGFFYIIGFGAYVEVDERALNALPKFKNTRFRVAASGTFCNGIQAAIGFLLILNFTSLIFPFYGPRVFQISEVSPFSDGGYNYNNLNVGDIVTGVNGTLLDVDNGVDLNSILMNKTKIKCSVGDTLNFKIYNSQNLSYHYKTVILGDYTYIGINYDNVSNDKIQILKVFTALEGGNNYDKNLAVGTNITIINGTLVDSSKNITLNYFLTISNPGDVLVLTAENGSVYNIDVDLIPVPPDRNYLLPGAYVFDNVYLGFTYVDRGNNNIWVSKVIENTTSGINEGILQEGDRIVKVERIEVQKESKNFKEIIDDLTIIPGETIKIKLYRNGEFLEISINTAVISMIPVKIGIRHSDYWVPKNVIGSWLSGQFPSFLLEQLLWFFIIAISLTIFNMLPIPAFDGDRMIKELINRIFGEKFDSVRNKSEKLYYFKKEKIYPLKEYRVNKIYELNTKTVETVQPDVIPDASIDADQVTNARLKLETEEIKTIIGPDNYELIDSVGDGHYDAISLKFPESSKIKDGTIFKVSYEHKFDSKKPLKKKILNTIRIITTSVFITAIVLSFINFGGVLGLLNF